MTDSNAANAAKVLNGRKWKGGVKLLAALLLAIAALSIVIIATALNANEHDDKNGVEIVKLIQGKAEIGKVVSWYAEVKTNDTTRIPEVLPVDVYIKSTTELEPGLFAVECETPGVDKSEEMASEGNKFIKTIHATSPFSGSYSNVYAETSIPEFDNETPGSYVWKLELDDGNGGAVDVTQSSDYNVSFFDSNANGVPDRLSWNIPFIESISEQIYRFEMEAGQPVPSPAPTPTELPNATPTEMPTVTPPEINNTNENITELVQQQAEVGKNVGWNAKIKAASLDEAKANLPASAQVISYQELPPELVAVEYETPGPNATEEAVDNYSKRVTLSNPADVSYENVLVYASVSDLAVAQGTIKIYLLAEGGKQEVSFSANDTDGNGVADLVEWTAPFLGNGTNETFEISIIILNPVTYLRDNETWIVAFNTTGAADLRISSNNSNWAELLMDVNETPDEMSFLDLSCGNTSLKNSLKIIDDQGVVHDYFQLTEGDSIRPAALLVENYSCVNETGYFKNFMRVAGYATLKFEFGNQTAFAYDPQISTNSITSIATCALSRNVIATGYCDDTNDRIAFQVLYTNGTSITSETIVDSSAGNCNYSSVDISALNSSEFVIAWWDSSTNMTSFEAHNTAGTKTSPTTNATTTTSGFSQIVSISAFSSLGIVIAWFNESKQTTANSTRFRSYYINGTAIAAETAVSSLKAGNFSTVSVAAFSDKMFVLGWYNQSNGLERAKLYYVNGTALSSSTGIAVDASAGTRSMTASVSAISWDSTTWNNSKWIIAWNDGAAGAFNYTAYYANTTVLNATVPLEDVASYNNSMIATAPLGNSSAFVAVWYNTTLSSAGIHAQAREVTSKNDSARVYVQNGASRFISVASHALATNTGLCLTNYVVAFANSTSQADFLGFYANGTSWNGNCPTYVSWNQSTIFTGYVQNGSSHYNNATITANGANTNVIITNAGGNGSAFMSASPTSDASMADAEVVQVNFTCTPPAGQANGWYTTVFNVNSTEYAQGTNISANCNVSSNGTFSITIYKNANNDSWFGDIFTNAVVTDLNGDVQSGVAGATVSMTVSPPANQYALAKTVSLRDDGVAPDTTANDGNYTVDYDISTNGAASTVGTNTMNVTAHKDGFPIDSSTTTTFTTIAVRRWWTTATSDTYTLLKLNEFANGTWIHNVSRFSVYTPTTARTNATVKIPILNQPTIWGLEKYAGINDAYVENNNVIVLHLNVTAGGTTFVNFSFYAASDLILTENDRYNTETIGLREGKNGFMVWNSHVESETFGLGYNNSVEGGETTQGPYDLGENVGMKVVDGESHNNYSHTDDCMERVGIVENATNGTYGFMLCGSCASYYEWNIKWMNPQNSYWYLPGEILEANANTVSLKYISENRTSQWGSAGSFRANKTITYWADKQYFKMNFTLIKTAAGTTNTTFVWGREPWVYPGGGADTTDRGALGNGTGGYPLVAEEDYNFAERGNNWFGFYDNSSFYGTAMLFPRNTSADSATVCAHFDSLYTPIGTNAGQADWPWEVQHAPDPNSYLDDMFCNWQKGLLAQNAQTSIVFYHMGAYNPAEAGLIGEMNANAAELRGNPTAGFGGNPADAYSTSSNSITFDLNCTSSTPIQSLELWGNWTGSWAANQTNLTASNNSYWNVTVVGFPTGNYLWAVHCVAEDGNDDWTNTNRTFTKTAGGAPSVSSTQVNTTAVSTSGFICINATATSTGTLDKVWAQVVYPNLTVSNITMTDTGPWCSGAGSDNVFGVNIGVGTTAANLTVNTTYANDTGGQLGFQSPFPNLQVNVSAAACSVAVGISNNMTGGVVFGSVASLPITNQGAQGNNGTGVTLFNVTLSVTGACTADLYIKADNDLISSGGYVIQLGNESYCYNTTNSSVPGTACTALGTSYTGHQIGSGLSDGAYSYLKFYLSIPAKQSAAAYNNTVTIKGVENGGTPFAERESIPGWTPPP